MLDITEPLRLSVGNNVSSGSGCAMNLVSWTNGDVEITDYPKCSDPILAQLVQNFNDLCCRCSIPRETWSCNEHKDDQCDTCEYNHYKWDYHMVTRPGDGEEGETICPEHAVIAIGLGFRTVGTGGWVEINGYGVWLEIAQEYAPDVDHSRITKIAEATAPEYPFNVGWEGSSEENRLERLTNWRNGTIRDYIVSLFVLDSVEDEQAQTVAKINAVIDAFYRHTGLEPEPVETERINQAARKMSMA